MKGRKTVNVQSMLDYANRQLAQKENEIVNASFKEGICTMIQRILFDTDNYGGFYFVDSNDSEIATFGYFSRIYQLKNR